MTESPPFASTLDALVRIVPERLQKPRIGIVCGSGLSTLVSSLRDVIEVPYTALEGFAKSTGESIVYILDAHINLRVVHGLVAGHKSILAFGLMGAGDGVPVVAMLGRVRILVLWVWFDFMRTLLGQIVPSVRGP